ncbi:MAG: DUF72 domain-containing protein [Endomicrobiia bacterium]
MTKIVKVGCCGFPVAQKKYYQEFECIEINSSFYQIPSLKVAEKWKKYKEDIKPDFEFIIKAWQIITHKCTSFTYRRMKEKPGNKKNYGFFMPTKEVFLAWDRTKEFALVLGAKKILFQAPASFLPTKENLKNLHNFFKEINADKIKYNFDFIIELRHQQWDKKIVSKIIKDLNLIHCVDPLYDRSSGGKFRYYRLHGLHSGNRLDYNYSFSEEELKKVVLKCDKSLNYVMFNNSTMYEDAHKFKKLLL